MICVQKPLRLVGAGYVQYYSKEAPKRGGLSATKDRFDWRISGQRQFYDLGVQILPYLADKQDKLRAALEMLELEQMTELIALTESG